jgi:hypothetical protein
VHEFQEAWAKFEPQNRPYVLDGDEVLLRPGVIEHHVILHHSWESVINQPDFGSRNARLHLSLLPQPFFGALSQARVFVLTLNPGLHPNDYFAEFCVPEYRKAAVDTLKQRMNGHYPFLWFDPRFSWHSGFAYWHGRFAGLIDSFAHDLALSRVEALSYFAKSVAIVELLPYHSDSFGLPGRIMKRLRSVRLAQSFAAEILAPRAHEGEVLLVAARQGRAWGLSEHEHIVIYNGAENRAAHLTPKSRGGQAILTHLKRVWQNAP